MKDKTIQQRLEDLFEQQNVFMDDIENLIEESRKETIKNISKGFDIELKKINEYVNQKEPFQGFEHKCICHWSKDEEYGHIPVGECPAHGKSVRKLLKNAVPVPESIFYGDKTKGVKDEKN